MLTPMDIHNKDFKKAMLRGYNPAEVDEFLDRIVVDYEKLVRDNEKLKEQTLDQEKELTQYRKMEKNIQDALTMAQNTADGLVNSARKNADDLTATAQKNADELTSTAQKMADEITSTARRNADELLETTKKTVEEMRLSTERECNSIRTQATLDAERQINEANNKFRNIMTEYEKILRDKNSFLMKMRTSLEAELAITNQMLANVPHHEAVKMSTTAPAAMSSLANVPIPAITSVEPPTKPKPVPTPPIVEKQSETSIEKPIEKPAAKPIAKPEEKPMSQEDLDRTAVFTKKTPRVK